MLNNGLLEGRTEEVKVATEVEKAPPAMDIKRILAFLGATYFMVMTTFIVPVACVACFMFMYPLVYISLPLFSKIENRLCRYVNDHWVAASVYCGMSVTEYGEDITPYSEKRVLYMPNHLALMDHCIVMQSLHDKGSVSGRWMWVIFNIWKYTPLGMLWTTHGNFFINGGPSQRDSILSSFKEHLKLYYDKFNYGWVIMYPEGSRLFLIKESSARYAEKNGLPALKHCALPRIGAAHAVMQVMAPTKEDQSTSLCGVQPPVEYIVDATLGYPHGNVPDVGAALMGDWPGEGGNRLSVHYEVIKVEPEWQDEEKFKQFLFKQYEKKDKLLEDYYEKGEFPGEKRPVNVPQSSMLFSQLLWMGIYYFHYTLWIRPLCALACRAVLSMFS